MATHFRHHTILNYHHRVARSALIFYLVGNAMSSVARLTKQLTRLSVVGLHSHKNITQSSSRLWTIPSHGFATNRKVTDAKNVKRLKIQAKKKKNLPTSKVSSE
jgi:hypothetical protein